MTLTVTLNSAKSYADTKKQEAINSASSDATNKVNSAKNELNTEINKKANSVDVYKKSETYTKSETDSKIKVAKDAIDLSVSTLQTTVATHTTQINNKADLSVVDQKIDSIEFGGVNHLKRSREYLSPYWNNKGATITDDYYMDSRIYKVNKIWGALSYTKNTELGLEPNTEYILSVYMKKDSGISYESGANMTWHGMSSVTVTTLDNLTTEWKQYSVIKKGKEIMERGDGQGARIEPNKNITGGYVYVCGFKLEKGNKATDWSPAPEDVESSIDTKANIVDVYNKTEVYTKAQTDSQIKVAKDSITQSVSTTYETKTNVTTQINGVKNSISSLQTRVNTAEQKITDSAIVSTVTSSQTYRDNLNGKVSTNQIISSINQTAESIKINASKIDLSGYVTISNLSGNGTTIINGANISTGVIKSRDGSFWFDLNNSRMAIYDNNRLLGITQKMRDNASGKYGLGFQANSDSFIALALGDNDDNTIYKPYIASLTKCEIMRQVNTV